METSANVQGQRNSQMSEASTDMHVLPRKVQDLPLGIPPGYRRPLFRGDATRVVKLACWKVLVESATWYRRSRFSPGDPCGRWPRPFVATEPWGTPSTCWRAAWKEPI